MIYSLNKGQMPVNVGNVNNSPAREWERRYSARCFPALVIFTIGFTYAAPPGWHDPYQGTPSDKLYFFIAEEAARSPTNLPSQNPLFRSQVY